MFKTVACKIDGLVKVFVFWIKHGWDWCHGHYAVVKYDSLIINLLIIGYVNKTRLEPNLLC